MLACWCRGQHISRHAEDRTSQNIASRHLQHTPQVLRASCINVLRKFLANANGESQHALQTGMLP